MSRPNKTRRQRQREPNSQLLVESDAQHNNFSIKNVPLRTITSTNIYENEQNLERCTKVRVGGIPLYSSEDDIWRKFEGCGALSKIECLKFPESGKFTGIAIITFETEAAGERALLLDGSDMDGSCLKIQSYKSERANKASPSAPAIVEGYNVGNFSDEVAPVPDSAKIRQRTCYESGEKARLSSACPEKQPTDQENPVMRSIQIKCEDSKPLEQKTNTNQPDSSGTNEVAPVPDGGKIRRRTCYECAEKGHISSACPRNQPTDQSNPITIPFQFSSRPPLFDGTNYIYWSNRMKYHVQAIDYTLWRIITDGPLIPMKKINKLDKENATGSAEEVPIEDIDTINLSELRKSEKEKISQNAKAINILHRSLCVEEYGRIHGCETAKEIWDRLEAIHVGTSQVKDMKLRVFISEYERFEMKKGETILSMHQRLNLIVNNLKSSGKKYSRMDINHKILNSLTEDFRPKICVITEAKDIEALEEEELIGSLLAYELHLNSRKAQDMKSKMERKSLAIHASRVSKKAIEEDSDE